MPDNLRSYKSDSYRHKLQEILGTLLSLDAFYYGQADNILPKSGHKAALSVTIISSCPTDGYNFRRDLESKSI